MLKKGEVIARVGIFVDSIHIRCILKLMKEGKGDCRIGTKKNKS